MRIHDLTLPVEHGTEAGFGLPPASLRLWQPTPDRGWWATEIHMPSHIGTHVDAPRHWLPDGATVEALDLATLIGPASVLDVRGRPDPQRITVDDLLAAAPASGSSRWLIATGWDRAIGSPEYFAAYPSLMPNVGDWLIGRRVRLLGVDMPSLSRVANAALHKNLLAAGVVVVEGLCRLDALIGRRFTLYVLPPRFQGADAAPVRAVAIQRE